MNTIWVDYGRDGRGLTKHLLETSGIARSFSASTKAAIKPNLVVATPSSRGATTSPQVVAGIIEFLQDCGVRAITIMESSRIGDSTERAFAACGYTELQRRYGVALQDLKTDDTVTKTVGEYQLQICRSPLEADRLINVPVLKAHCQTKLTCALKNLKGCIPDGEKRRYHTLGLHGPIAALAKALPQDFVVVDGLNGDLSFEEGGTPVAMDRVLVGADPVAVDSYCADLIGYTPESISYIGLAESLGVGCRAYEVNALNPVPAAAPEAQPLMHRHRHRIREDQACSACLGSLLHALERLGEERNRLPEALYIGQGWQEKKLEGPGIGRCTDGMKAFVPGCPPSAAEIKKFLQTQDGR